MKTLQTDFFKAITTGFAESLHRASQKPNKKNIHALRVASKKIHALLLFLESTAPEKVNSKKIYRHFNKLFSKAGKYRTTQLHIEELEELSGKVAGKELKKLKEKQKKKQKNLQLHIKEFNRKKHLKKIDELIKKPGSNTALNGKATYAFAIHAIKDSIQLSGKQVFHRARKHLKDAHYLLETLPHDAKAKALLYVFAPMEKKIGRWHDLQGSLPLFQKLADKHKDGTSALQIRNKAKRINKEIAKLESELKSDFSQLKNKVLKAI